MKKVLALLLSIFLILSQMSCAFASYSQPHFLLNIISLSASEWAATSKKRTLFTACAMWDLIVSIEGSSSVDYDIIASIMSDSVMNNNIGFAVDSTTVTAVFSGDSGILMIAYEAPTNILNYAILHQSSWTYSIPLNLDTVKQALVADGVTFYEIDSDDYLAKLQQIGELIAN